MTFGSRLRSARKAKNLTQRELGRLIDAAHNSISNWEKDRNMPDPDTIQHLCWVLDVQPNYFFRIDNAASDNALPLFEPQKLPEMNPDAFDGSNSADDNEKIYADVHRIVNADFAIICKDDSMINARIFNGDIVYIRQQNTVLSGQIAAVMINNQPTLKRVFLFDDHIILESENPMYKPVVYWDDEMRNVHILGRAVAFTSLLR